VLLIPLLKDKNEFVRREAAYALGETRSHQAVDGLVTALETDKLPSVRGAAAVALGLIANEKALNPLAGTIDLKFHGSVASDPRKKRKAEKDLFVQRAAVRSLGQIGSRASVPVLIAAMTNERLTFDIRREAATSLGLIGDPSAVPVLRTTLDAPDAYLSKAAFDALARISRNESQRQR
jgi:HEAT repeat protein